LKFYVFHTLMKALRGYRVRKEENAKAVVVQWFQQ
jgi:hypothetical protein